MATMWERVYVFERDNTQIGFLSANRPSTDPVNAVIEAIGECDDWKWNELSDQDSAVPQICITSSTDEDFASFEIQLSKAAAQLGVRIKSVG